MLYDYKYDAWSWENVAALVTQQNKVDETSSKEKILLSPDCAAAHFGFQAYGLASKHLPCFLWIFPYFDFPTLVKGLYFQVPAS